MRRQSPPAPTRSLRASGDRWLFGYADIVTLLFACFASLYAARPPVPVTAVPAVATAPKPTSVTPPIPAARQATSDLERALQDVVDSESASMALDLSTSSRGLVLSLAEAGSFAAGRADLTPGAERVMLSLADALRPLSNQIRVEGHTDNVPVHTALFGSNWELSTARATRVVELLIDVGGLDPLRLSAAGYAEYHPRLPNDSPEARARNRRVDIVVLDR